MAFKVSEAFRESLALKVSEACKVSEVYPDKLGGTYRLTTTQMTTASLIGWRSCPVQIQRIKQTLRSTLTQMVSPMS